MLENRSFDSMLGKLYPKSATFDGFDGTEQNPDSNGVPVQVWSSTGTDESTMRIPDPDPGELWTDINTQLFGMPNVGSPAPFPTMDVRLAHGRLVWVASIHCHAVLGRLHHHYVRV